MQKAGKHQYTHRHLIGSVKGDTMAGRIPDWVPFIGTKDKVDYWMGDNTAKEIESGEWSGMLPGDQSGASQYVPGVGAPTPEGHGYLHDDIPVIGTKEKAMDAVNAVGDAARLSYDMVAPGLAAGYDHIVDKGRDAYNYMTAPSTSIREFDMNDKESVKALQRRLGVKDDGMFGPQTEAAYRAAVAEEDAAANKEALKYDYNDAMLQERMDGSKSKFGGLLKKAWHDADKKWFGGKLKGGYDEGNIMTAKDYKNR